MAAMTPWFWFTTEFKHAISDLYCRRFGSWVLEYDLAFSQAKTWFGNRALPFPCTYYTYRPQFQNVYVNYGSFYFN
jgi:hypothetical protein